MERISRDFTRFGGISMVFALAFIILLYDAGVGLNYFLFTILMVSLLVTAMKEFEITIKRSTWLCYAGAIVLGLSTMMTANGTLQFLNIIGIMLLLDISLLYQIDHDARWDFARYAGQIWGLLFRSIASLGMPFSDSYQYIKNTKMLKNDRTRNVLVGLCLSIPLLFIVISLLSSADMLFGSLTNNFFGAIISENIVIIVIMFLFGFLSCYCILCAYADMHDIEHNAEMDNQKTKKKGDPTVAITIMVLLLGVYVLFCAIQITYLFANGFFVLPQEFTFAEYARRGFFELFAVTIINILLILTCTILFRDSKVLRYILTGITICSYIMIASAAYRMILYVDTYHLTFLRLLVFVFLVIDTFVLAGVIISVFRKDFPLFRYCVLVTSCCYIPFSLAKPDYHIANYHIGHVEKMDFEDIYFLAEELSMDAAPVVLPLLEENATKYKEIKNLYSDEILRQDTKRGIRDYNFSYDRAAKMIK